MTTLRAPCSAGSLFVRLPGESPTELEAHSGPNCCGSQTRAPIFDVWARKSSSVTRREVAPSIQGSRYHRYAKSAALRAWRWRANGAFVPWPGAGLCFGSPRASADLTSAPCQDCSEPNAVSALAVARTRSFQVRRYVKSLRLPRSEARRDAKNSDSSSPLRVHTSRTSREALLAANPSCRETGDGIPSRQPLCRARCLSLRIRSI